MTRYAGFFFSLAVLGFVLCTACSTGGGGGGGGGGGDTTEPDADGENQNQSADGQSEAAAAFTASNCTQCHTAETNNFSDSSVDDIVDALLGETPHPGADLTALTDDEIELFTDYLIDISMGAEDLPDGDPDANENSGDDQPDGQASEWFDQVWTDFDRNYSHFATKDVDWDALRAQYEPGFSGDLSAAGFIEGIVELLAELRDLHVWVFNADGETVEVYSRPADPNYPEFFPLQHFPDGIERWTVVQEDEAEVEYPLWHGWLNHNIAFMAIDTFDSSEWEGLRTGQVDELFETYADASAFVVDIRSNNGGNEEIARTFAGHLTDESYVYGYHRDRIPGSDHDEFGDWVEHRVEPAENARVLRPTACLIGEVNLSSAEWFVLMMLENPRGVTLIGDTTRGSSGNPQAFEIEGVMEYYVPSWEAYRADQSTPIEDVGIAPSPGFSIAPEESFTDTQDLVLERAISLFVE